MMPVSSAMSKTGAGKVIAEWAVGLMGGTPSPMIVTAVLFILSCGLTQFMSNTASAALLCPIGIAISKQLGADPAAVLMAIAVAASCAFATPVGTPPNRRCSILRICDSGRHASEHPGIRPRRLQIHGLRKSRYRSGNRLLRYLPDSDSYVLALLPRQIIYEESSIT